jgi:sialate O-acetylesterase
MRFASPFQDHAVLQRDKPIPVWGWAGPDEGVVVRLGGAAARMMTGADGRWLVRLPAMPAGGPHELVAAGPSGEARLRDILVGEVWIASGQSNMAFTLAESLQGPPEEESNLPRMRLLNVNTQAFQVAQSDVCARWQLASHSTLSGFSAVAGWFGRILHRELGVPVGLICNAWGATRIQAWTSREALVSHPLGVDDVLSYENYAYRPAAKSDKEFTTEAEWEAHMAARDTGNAGLAKGWAAPDFDDSGWKTMSMPARWQDYGHAGSGVFWFRRAVRIPAAWRGLDLEVSLGAADKHDDTYVGGERVGGLSWADGPNTWRTPRVYRVPARLVGADGVVRIAVRDRSHVHHGGMIGPAAAMRLHAVGEAAGALRLDGDWRYECEQDWGVQDPVKVVMWPGNANAPYTLFDSRIAPLVPYGVRGFIWYQGESNVAEAAAYRELLPLMIRDWRRAFGQGDLAFLQVQIANHGFLIPKEPRASDTALLREAQAAALSLPAVGMAVAIDVGDAHEVHPRDKRSVGERLARWAPAETYGRGGVPSGPLYEGMTIEAGNRIRIRFRHAGGLRTRDGGKPQHVAIAGTDRVFVWAEAAIEGETLLVWHSGIARPAAVRYAWADNPENCNLVNGAGLPAAPFRTDHW